MAGGTGVNLTFTRHDELRPELLARFIDGSVALDQLTMRCGGGLGFEPLAALSRLLARTTSLRKLDLSFSWPLDEQGIVLMAAALEKNRTCEDLNLQRSGIYENHLPHFCRVLATNQTLRSLNLSGNFLGFEAFLQFAEVLKNNRSLEELMIRPSEEEFDNWEERSWPSQEELNNMEKYPRRLPYLHCAFREMIAENVSLFRLKSPYLRSDAISKALMRNEKLIPAAVNRAVVFVIGIRQSCNLAGMGHFAIIGKDVVKLIAQMVWADRKDPKWLEALRSQ